jgi:MoxR-like ATPase
MAVVAAQSRRHPLESLAACATTEQVQLLRQCARDVRISEELRRYAVDMVRATRGRAGVQLGASPRASLALTHVAQALALVDGCEFVTPDHLRELAVPVLAHRLVVDPQARFGGVSAQGIVEDILAALPAPL